MTRYHLRGLLFAAAIAVAFMSAMAGAAYAAASGYAISPDRTSVEADFSQVFSARFLNASGLPAAGETVTFSNDACGRFSNGTFVAMTNTDANGVASMNFTAMQPGGTVCTIVAAATGAQVRFQVFTYRPSQLGFVATAPTAPAPGQSFEVGVDFRMGVYSLPNVNIGARVATGPGSANISPGSANSGSGGYVNFNVTPTASGDFDLAFSLGATSKVVPIRYAAADPWRQDLWWSGPGENGWGLTIIEHRDILFMLIFAYDAMGQPTWYVVSSGTWDVAGTTYTGSMYSPRGTPFYSYDAARLAIGAPVGALSITYTDHDRATLRYTINGVSGEKAITRFAFGPSAVAPLTGRTDMWWGGVAQNGWGIAVIQQNAALFTMWYTYDAAGMPLWYTMPSGSWTASDTYEGRVYRTTSSPWLGRAYDPSLFRPVDVGSYRLRFSGETASFEYTVDGRTGTLPLTRTPF